MEYGYGPVTGTLTEHGLVDELRLWLHPILVGRGEMNDLVIGPGDAEARRPEAL